MTAPLALPLGGWSPERDSQRRALERGLSDPAEARTRLDGLGVPGAADCVRHTRGLSQVVAASQLTALLDQLALSPDPAAAARSLRALFERPDRPELSERALGVFLSLASQSAFLGRFLARRPDALVDLGDGLSDGMSDGSSLTEGRTLDELRQRSDRLLALLDDHSDPDEERFALALRHLRTVELARIFYREVRGLAAVDVTGREVSDLAAALIDTAYRASRRLLGDGADAAEDSESLLVSIIGLGKLGARELNFSSDVDLLFVANDVVTRRPDLARLGEKIVQRASALLDRPLQGGRVFRVDLRLRPDGTRGPLLGFPRGLRDYYEGLARTWERAALLRARVVAGDPQPGRLALHLLAPIRYPRGLSPTVIEALRTMKDRIDRHESWRHESWRHASSRRHAQRVDVGWDTKVGRGGIREVEFVVAAFQYLLAGREPRLRGLSTYQGLGEIAALRLIEPADAHDLDEAYRFYRLLEHRLQMDEDRQTQRLPSDAEGRQRLARRLGFRDWSGLDARLDTHRGRVREIFERTLTTERRAPPRRPADDVLDALTALMRGQAVADDVIDLLARVGFGRPRSALGALRVLWKQPGGAMSAQALLDADRLPAYLLDATLRAPDPDAAMAHLYDLLAHPHGGAAVQYLRSKPAPLRSVTTLLGASDFLARKLTRNPRWIDGLLGAGTRVLETRDELADAWARARTRAPELEARLNLLRRFRTRQVIRIAMAYLDDVFDDDQLAEQLTLLAELALTATVEEARRDLGGALDDFLVIGMGRLGSREMGFASDLDLVFAYQGTAEEAERYGRLARRLIHFLNTPMPDGVLYQVDLRLRPWGAEGTVVTTLAGFADYYARRADPWERVALVRGRPIAGPPTARQTFERARDRVCRLAPEAVPDFVARLDEVRQRLQHEVAKHRPGRYHLKYGPGGLLAIELLALVGGLMRRASSGGGAAEPSRRLSLAIDRLQGGGVVADADVTTLGEAYRFYRRLQNVLRLTLDRSVDQFEPAQPALRRARQLLGRRVPELAEPAGLEAQVRHHTTAVHGIYQRTVLALTRGATT